jgi:septal ring factor EnvC (AmiA/AmiB activator)
MKRTIEELEEESSRIKHQLRKVQRERDEIEESSTYSRGGR